MVSFRFDAEVIPNDFDTILKYSYSSHKNSFDVCPIEIALIKQMNVLGNYTVMAVNFSCFLSIARHVILNGCIRLFHT